MAVSEHARMQEYGGHGHTHAHTHTHLGENAENGGIGLGILHVEEVAEVVEDIDLHGNRHVVERAGDEDPEEVPVRLRGDVIGLVDLGPVHWPPALRVQWLVFGGCPCEWCRDDESSSIHGVCTRDRQGKPQAHQAQNCPGCRHPSHQPRACPHLHARPDRPPAKSGAAPRELPARRAQRWHCRQDVVATR